jgi:hypothetical protein
VEDLTVEFQVIIEGPAHTGLVCRFLAGDIPRAQAVNVAEWWAHIDAHLDDLRSPLVWVMGADYAHTLSEYDQPPLYPKPPAEVANQVEMEVRRQVGLLLRRLELLVKVEETHTAIGRGTRRPR